MPGDQTVSLESAQSKLILKGGKSRFTLQSLPAEDFPLVQESANFGPVFSVPQKTLKDLLGQVSFAMAVHDIRYYLNGILFVAEGKQLSLVATDGHRLAFSSAMTEETTTTTTAAAAATTERPALPDHLSTDERSPHFVRAIFEHEFLLQQQNRRAAHAAV